MAVPARRRDRANGRHVAVENGALLVADNAMEES
jgi:hypothetical protein